MAIKTVRRATVLLLAAALLLALCGCGQEGAAYRVLSTLGQRNYTLIFRLDDGLAKPVMAAMDVLAARGRLSEISRSRLGEDRITMRGSGTALDALEESVQPRLLIAGVEDESAPMAWYDGTGYTGMSVDIASAIGSILGWTVRIQPISADEVAAQLASGNIDVAIGFDPSDVPEGDYTLGKTYMESDILLVTSSNSGVRSIRDLKEDAVGTLRGSAMQKCVTGNKDIAKYMKREKDEPEDTRHLTVNIYLSPSKCIAALNSNLCGAIAMDRILLRTYYVW